MELNKIYNGDCLEVLKAFPDNSIDSCVTDPPYGISFMNKHWDYQIPSVEVWKEVLRVLKPGGYILCACGTRTQHRMAVNIEDAGFEIRDVITWHYGCLSDDTEVLTAEGWIVYKDLNILNNNCILCYDISTNKYHFEQPEKWNEYKIKDTCYRIQSDFTDQIVSRNHRCIIEREGKLLFEFAGKVAQEQQAYVPILESMPGMQQFIFNLNERAGDKEQMLFKGMYKDSFTPKKKKRNKTFIKQDLRQLWNNIFRKNKQACKILQQEVQRINKGKRFGEICIQRKISVERTIRERLDSKNDRDKESIMERRSYLQKQKRILQRSEDKICEMSTGISKYEQEGWLCDGIQADNGTTNRENVNQNGVRSPYRSQPNEQRKNKSDVIQEQQRPQEVRVGAGYKTTLATFIPFEYSGIIFCPTVSTGAFVARRNGKIFITGNSGFPKSLDIGKAVDKLQGNEREDLGVSPAQRLNKPDSDIYEAGIRGKECRVTKGNSEYEGWGTALKPATEFWTLARKPIEESTVAKNVLKYGTGGLNIDGSRIETDDEIKPVEGGIKRRNKINQEQGFRPYENGFDNQDKEMWEQNKNGRFPANVIFDEFTGKILDEQTSILTSGNIGPDGFKGEYTGNVYGKFAQNQIPPGSLYGDSGGASKFFYCPKADGSERNKGVKGEGKFMDESREVGSAGGTNPRNRGGETQRKNYHPTVKPIDLMRYLVKLITVKGGTCIDPYCGSGTTLIGAKLELINYLGIDREAEYCKIAEARVASWNPDKYKAQTLF